MVPNKRLEVELYLRPSRRWEPPSDDEMVVGGDRIEPEVLEIPRGVEQDFAFYMSDDSTKIHVDVCTTLGAFSRCGEQVTDQAPCQHLLSEEAGGGHVFIVFEDSEGDAALWERHIRVY